MFDTAGSLMVFESLYTDHDSSPPPTWLSHGIPGSGHVNDAL